MSYNKQKQARKQQQGKTHCKQQGLVLTVWCSAVRKSMMWRESSILIKMISRESPEVSAFSRLHRSPCWKLTFLLQLFLVVDGTKLWSFHWLATITGIFQSPLVSRASIFWCVCFLFFYYYYYYLFWVALQSCSAFTLWRRLRATRLTQVLLGNNYVLLSCSTQLVHTVRGGAAVLTSVRHLEDLWISRVGVHRL